MKYSGHYSNNKKNHYIHPPEQYKSDTEKITGIKTQSAQRREGGRKRVIGMKWHQLNRGSGGEWDQLFDTETKEWGSNACGLPHPITPRILLTFIPWCDTHSGWMVVIRTSVRLLQASSGLSGRGHYHWLITGIWSILAAMSHFSPHTHTLLPFTIQSQVDRVKSWVSMWRNWKGGGEVWLGSKSYNKPIRFREDDMGVRRSKPKITNPTIYIWKTKNRENRCSWMCKCPPLSQMLELLGRCCLYRCVCAVLLEGGEGLEEFGQVNLRVATGGQGFNWHFLQPPIHISFSVPQLCASWRWREERKELSLPKLNGRSFTSSTASKSILQASETCAFQSSERFTPGWLTPLHPYD